MRKRWKVRSWKLNPSLQADDWISLQCQCGNDALVPVFGHPGALLIASFGMRLVFDPPGHVPPLEWMPDALECKRCGTVYESERSKEAELVR